MPGPPILTDTAITSQLAALPGWERSGDALVRTYVCVDFPSAIAFVTRAGFAAEAMNHHPDIDIRWRRVHVACTTHDSGGITELDLTLAAALDRAAIGLEG